MIIYTVFKHIYKSNKWIAWTYVVYLMNGFHGYFWQWLPNLYEGKRFRFVCIYKKNNKKTLVDNTYLNIVLLIIQNNFLLNKIMGNITHLR